MTTAPVTTQNPVNPDDAAQAIGHLERALDELLAVVEEETALVSTGRVRQAAELESRKSELARSYLAGSARIKANRDVLTRCAPDAFQRLTQRHNEFRSRLQINMTVLATAHAVSEGIIKGVSGELARKTSPSTYGSGGLTNAPSPRAWQPLAVSRSI